MDCLRPITLNRRGFTGYGPKINKPRSYWYVCLYDKDNFELLEIVPAGGFLYATLLRVDFIRAGFDPFFVRLTSLRYALSESGDNIPAWLYRLRPKTYTGALRAL